MTCGLLFDSATDTSTWVIMQWFVSQRSLLVSGLVSGSLSMATAGRLLGVVNPFVPGSRRRGVTNSGWEPEPRHFCLGQQVKCHVALIRARSVCVTWP